MKKQLRDIYADVSNGKLSQNEALAQIKAIKLQGAGKVTDALLVTPVWQQVALEASPGKIPFTEHYVVLCERSPADAEMLGLSLPHSRCMTLQAGQQESIAQRYSEYALACFEHIKIILQGKPQGNVLIQIVVADQPEQALLAGLSGLLKTAALENPRITGQLILVAADMRSEELAWHLEEEKTGGWDPLVRYEHGERKVLRWQEVPDEPEQPPIAFKDRGVYLITGGLGGLAVLFAKEIVDQAPQARVVLAGRSPSSTAAETVLGESSWQAGRVSYRQMDVRDLAQVKQVITAVEHDHGQLNGILHSAGMIGDNFILKKSGAQFREVLAPKVTGTFNLDEASRDVELDFFVLFSSFAGALGNVGQADYAAANGFMDQFSAYRNQQVAAGLRHGRTRSINWPLWQSGGMLNDPASREILEQATGLQPMQTATGMRTFYRSLALPYDQLMFAEGDLTQMRRALLAGRPIQGELPASVVTAEPSGDNLIEQTQNYLRRQFSEILKLPSHRIDPQVGLEKYGIDSILAMKLTSRLEKTFNSLPKTLFFEYQTIRELSQYFVQSHAARLATLFPGMNNGQSKTKAVDAPIETLPPAVSKRATSRRFNRMPGVAPGQMAERDPIAIIGLSGRYPEAVDIEAYWRNLRDGKDCIIEVPKDRWDWHAYFSDDRTRSGQHYSKWGGFISGVGEFDPLFFNISPKDAKYIDPQERLFLQHAWMAIEDAGYTRASLQVPYEHDLAGQVGVYAGVMYSEYQLLGVESSLQGKPLGIAGSAASIANRVSYALNLHGPSMTLDTMCSSSLTAIHLACQDLKLGRTTLAIAGGVNVSIHPNKYLMLSAGQFISSDGHCQSFGEGGDGYIPGEGVGVVVLKRLADATRDGDHIYGVIRGSALNHGGKTNGYTVPNPQAQATAISRALTESHTEARHISYIEAHGTGTKLGDPIEIAALSKAFQRQTDDTQFCLIGSAKSNIGHCESAAGIAGLTKVLLQMQHQQIVPSLHSAQLNPHIDFDASPFVVSQTLRSWEQPVIDGQTLPRIAGISSFGAGGSNAHMIIEEYQAPAMQATVVAPVVILLSARTPEQLQQKVGDLLQFVLERLSTINLESMAYTLQLGREPMDERLGIIVSSVEQLAETLQAYGSGQQAIEDAYRGDVKRNRDALSAFSGDPDLQQTVEKWITGRKFPKLLDLWVKGLDVDWSKFYGQPRPRRMSLPTYPFARERYWIDVVPVTAQAGANTVLHPLLHTNTSDMLQQSYSSMFSGEESFLSAPAAAYLEMARAAVHYAVRTPREAFVELRDIVWAQPIVMPAKKQVNIALLANGLDEIDFEIYSEDADSSANDEIVHCQGRAIVSREPAPAGVDLDQLARSGQRLVPLRLPQEVEKSAGDFFIHPILIDMALQAAGVRLPVAIETLRIVEPCGPEMTAMVRTVADKIDIDLCDPRGSVAVQIRGIRRRERAVETIEPVAVPKKIAVTVRQPREIAFAAVNQSKSAPVECPERSTISLTLPRKEKTPQPLERRSSITLSSTKRGSPGKNSEDSVASSVRLYELGDGIFSIRIGEASTSAEVVQALERAQQEGWVKVLLISGLERAFAPGGRESHNEAVEQKLYRTLAAFPFPVIAVLQDDTIGPVFMAAALCDFMIWNEDARYGYTDGERGFYPTTAEERLFCERFGDVRAQELLYLSATSTGKQMRRKGWTCPILPPAEIEAYAQQLSSTLASKPQEALRLLKQHLTRNLASLVEGLTPVGVAEPEEEAAVRKTVIAAEHIRVETPVDHVLAITFGIADARDVVTDLGRIFTELQEDSWYKAIVLSSDDPEFLFAVPDDDVLDVKRLIGESKIPVVAALTRNAKGNAWLVAQFCDACVYSRDGVYSTANLGQSQMAAAVFAHRLGNEAANEILLTGADYSGGDLQQRADALRVAERDHVVAAAVDIAEHLARLPRTTLASWKSHTATTLQQKIQAMPAAGASAQTDDLAASPVAPVTIALQSNVVTATAYPYGIVVVTMEDREARNMFSAAFMKGVTEAFAHIEQTPAYKVVILTGYDSYFASGGTKESLLAVQQGTARFTDFNTQLALDCKLPVIAAMQGHGIGAGWALGMFADVVILSEESRYVSPYMDYGFTPGAGATSILGEKMGTDLARESLLTAQPHSGRDLKERGLALRVLPRVEVYAAAMALAGQMAHASRGRLIGLKQQLTAYLHASLEETYRLELAMHEATFVGRSETLARIQRSFFPEIDTRPAEPLPPRAESPVPSPVPSRVPAGGSDVLVAVTATLRTLLANELQMRESDVDEHAKFVDLGLESIGGVTWVRKINEKYQTSIDPTTVYSYPTLADFSRFVREEAESRGTLSHTVAMPAAAAPVASAKSPSTQYQNATKLTSWRSRAQPRLVSSTPVPPPSEAIAIIGIAGQFPQARNLDEFWQNIAQGRNCITQVPPERWDVSTWYQSGESAAGKTNSQWFGALEEYDLFDPLFFNISPRDAESMDPQQRLFLQACWHSIENAGYDARSLSGSKCGVFAGCAYGDYHLLSREQQLSAQGFTGDATSILAGRVSYVLNLQGPCFTLDTACSSSLVAIAQACDSLVSGASNLALAGGVYVMAGPEMHVKSSQVGMLSPDGKCYSFDQRANGFVPGEGVGVVLLKRLTDAERDGDLIQAVIQGWGVNQDGKTNGITAPNTESQTRLEQDVYDRFTIDPANIQLVEAHGTGTMLGDPIEVRGLKKAFEKYTQNQEYCALGSVKSNIGHCLTAAGIAGVAKVVLALQHKQLPPTINFEHLNEHIDLTNSPFYVNSRLQPWEPVDARPRQAAISAFGFSGTNAHMVIGEYVPNAVMKPAVSPFTRNEKVMIPLSARTAGQLMQKAVNLRAFIGRQTQSIDLDALAYTLQVGRDPMEERLGVLVRSVEELAEKLEAWISGAADVADLHQAQVKRSKESIAIISQDDEMREAVMEKCFAGRKLSKLMELWVKGLDVEWNRLYGEAKPQRISLPLYPFAKERYWIDAPTAAPVASAGRSWLHGARVLSRLHREKMRGVSSAAQGTAAAQPAPVVRNEIVLQPVAAATPVAVERKKPAIALAAPRPSVGSASPSASTRPSVTLANVSFAPAVSTARLYDSGNGVFSIDIAVTSTIAHLREALDRAQQEASLKVLMLNGIERCFSRGGRSDYNEAVEQQLYRSLVTFPYPVIGVVEGDAIGAGFLAAALCDFMVCSEGASYGYLAPTSAELAVFSERFGDAIAQDFLYRATPLTDKELRARGWTCPVAPPLEVAAYARKLASTLATKPRDALHLLKQHLARHLGEPARELTRVEVTIDAEEPAGSVRVVTFRDASDLLRRVADVQQDPDSKAIVLASEDSAFLSGISDDVVLDLQRLIVESEIPIVAALTGNASGNAWLITQFCDAVVYNRLGVYSASGLGPVQTAAAMFRHRFGTAAGSEILLTGAGYSGADLLRRAGTMTVAEHDDVLAAAVRVAEVWVTLPRVTLAAWKKQAAGTLDDKIRCLPAMAGSDEISERPIPMLIDAPTQVALHSRAVTATAHPEGIVVVKMEDREAKNMFSDAFVEGVAEAFAHIDQTPAYKVVVLTGFDSYFASGGTKEGLVAIQQGKARFTDFDIHQSALNCKLPVIAAMQGHGIGAGWCLGMFADIVLLSEESRYVSPYMDYGFTPGAGATFILADKIGQDLARESMLTAQYVTGSELKARGLLLPILPRAEVVPAAMTLARQIARVSRGRLIGVKQLLSSHVHQALAETYRLELAMHEKTFVGHTGTLAQIQSKFNQEIERPQVAAQLATAEPASPFMDTDVLRAVTTTLRSLIASELLLPEGDIEEDVEFVSLGLDSISAVTLIRNVNAKYRTSIEATKIYRYPTLAQLGVFVKEEAEKNGVLPNLAAPRVAPRVVDAPAQPTIVTSPVVSKRTGRRRRGTQKQMVNAPGTQASDAIAIIGMSGRFPGAQNLEEYWQNIAQGRNSVTEVPPARWDINRYAHARWLGVLDDVDCFDPLFFRISPQEAEYIDPQHRLFLQESYKAFEDAGYASNSLSNKRCGVYLGISNNDYSLLLQKQGVLSTPVTSNSFAVAAARIAYYLNLKGPAISVDTACSSSLVAIHLACQGLLSGETDMALAGGVTLWLTPDSHLSMSEAGMLSAVGQCKTFDDSADGIVLGDGVGAVVLKRLKDAQADHDVIHGVILGSGINQDGRTNGITAPSVNSQIELERSVYARYEIDPGTITYVEAHGTGTKLGDPIELEALAAAFQERTDRKNYCALGSVKSNIGHTASAAGVASVLKVLLSMRHRTLAPTLHVTKENAHFDFSESPFYIGREAQAWETAPGSRRRAAVSAFGYSGTNAHLVMEEWVPSAEQALLSENGPVIVPLSGRTAEQLRQKARDLADFLRTVPMPVDLQSVAYTLQAGRDAMEERAVFVVSSVDQLIGTLAGYVDGEKGIECAWQGRVDSGSDGIALMGRDDDVREAVDKWIAHGKYAKLAELWSRGLNFDWNKLYGAEKPQRVSLPTYPFARERFWIDKTIGSPADDELLRDIAAMGSIEDILSKIDGGAMETDHALRLLKMLV